MCGIVGVIRLSQSAPSSLINKNLLEKLLHPIRGRGPDARGTWLDRGCHVGLAHVRLSTLDPRANANQPMMDSEGSVCIVFNGEIYNYMGLKSQLVRDGYCFKTSSDTEVLLNAYKAYGEAMLPALEGQFSFVLYDLQKRKILIARDPLGICPLYFTILNECLFVASEPHALLQIPGFQRELNQKALYYFLITQGTPFGETLFKGIQYVRAGHCFYFDLFESPTEIRYSDPHFCQTERDNVSHDAWSKQFLQLLQSAVSRRMISDKEVGIFLSGGIDSATILSLIRQIEPDQHIKSFSFGFEEMESKEVVGELPWARQLSKTFHTDNEEIVLKASDFVSQLGTFSLPPAFLSETIFHIMSKRAAERGVEVVLSGEGSDETFFGYDFYFAVLAQLSKKYGGLAHRYPLRGDYSHIKKPWKLTDIFCAGGADLSIEARKHDIFGEGFEVPGPAKAISELMVDELNNISPHASLDKQMMYVDLTYKIPEYTLRRVERVVGGNGVEMRFPFLDLRIIQKHFQLPLEERICGGEFKGLLKTAMSDLLPADVIQRSKSPYGLPATRSSYFQGSNKVFKKPALSKLFYKNYEQVYETIFCSSLIQEDIFNRAYLKNRLDQQRKSEIAYFDAYIWKIWSLSAWYENWIKGRAAA